MTQPTSTVRERINELVAHAMEGVASDGLLDTIKDEAVDELERLVEGARAEAVKAERKRVKRQPSPDDRCGDKGCGIKRAEHTHYQAGDHRFVERPR